MRRLFVCFYIIDQLVYITLDIAGVGKRIIMQKGFFAYKGDEKCISHKKLTATFRYQRLQNASDLISQYISL